MYEVENLRATYEKPQSLQLQGNWSYIRQFLRDGYHVTDERNGWWLLTKNSQVIVYLECTGGRCFTFKARANLLGWYGGTRLTQKLVDRFISDFYGKKIKICVDDGNFYIINAA